MHADKGEGLDRLHIHVCHPSLTSHENALQEAAVTPALKFAMAVIYTNDVPGTVTFYERATALTPSYYDRELGFAVLGPEQAVAVASHAAGTLMLEAGFDSGLHGHVRGTELAFWADDVPAAFEAAVRAGATALTPPRTMPWGQTVAYVEAPEGTILGFITPPAPAVLRRNAVTSTAPRTFRQSFTFKPKTRGDIAKIVSASAKNHIARILATPHFWYSGVPAVPGGFTSDPPDGLPSGFGGARPGMFQRATVIGPLSAA